MKTHNLDSICLGFASGQYLYIYNQRARFEVWIVWKFVFEIHFNAHTFEKNYEALIRAG